MTFYNHDSRDGRRIIRTITGHELLAEFDRIEGEDMFNE